MSQEHPILEPGSTVCITPKATNFLYLGRVDYTGHRFVVLSNSSTIETNREDDDDAELPGWEDVLNRRFDDKQAIVLPPPGMIAINIDHILDVVLWPHTLPVGEGK